MSAKTNNFISAKPIIEKWEEYVVSFSDDSIYNFAKWILNDKENSENLRSEDLQNYFDTQSEEHNLSYLNSEAGFLIGRLYKFIKIYTKSVLKECNISSLDEFGILAYIDLKKVCSKKDAISETLIDNTTGIDIIKRLIFKEFVDEKTNPDDKREKLVSTSEKGKLALTSLYMKLGSIQDLLIGMNEKEKINLVNFLKRLDKLHTEIIEKN